ncbi:hypothetical protein DFJ77DRAFT_452380 [Powellomyces hirtus]|nr:hypothetical protein DFJ77DRAFT_452380 [Powellomyces hirtus]
MGHLLPQQQQRAPLRGTLFFLNRRLRLTRLKLVAFFLALPAAFLVWDLGPSPPSGLWAEPNLTSHASSPLPGSTGHNFNTPRLTLTHPPKQPKPLCVIAVWEKGPLPEYVRASLDSFGAAATRNPYADLYLFVPPSLSLKAVQDLYASTKPAPWPANVHVVDIGHVNPEWRTTGWTGFLTHQLCQLYGYRLRSTLCQTLKESIERKVANGGATMVNMRPAYGDLFAPWINPTRCSSWGWADLDTIWGDIGSLLNAPFLNRHTDVFTVSFGDDERVYTRGQLTVFNHAKQTHPEVLNSVWRKCSELATITAATAFFNLRVWTALDEGCAADAVIKSGKTFTVVPLQLAAGSRDSVLIRVERGILYSCYSARATARSRDDCRNRIDEIATHQVAQNAGRNRPSPFAAPYAQSIPITLSQPKTSAQMCAHWLPINAQWCAKSTAAHDRSAWWAQVVNTDSQRHPALPKSKSLKFSYPRDLQPDHNDNDHGYGDEDDATIYNDDGTVVQIDVMEFAVVHFQNWKRNYKRIMYPPHINANALAEGRAAIEVYEDADGIHMEAVDLVY